MTTYPEHGDPRVFNFSSGPAALPLAVLERARDELTSLPGCGASVMEISHRSHAFGQILESARDRIRRLLDVPSNYTILFLQGGSRLQFSMVPMNLLQEGGTAAFIVSGHWSKVAMQEAAKLGSVDACWDGEESGFNQLPETSQLCFDHGLSYVHMTSNETIQGVQYRQEPDTGDTPLVCDASSDFLSRPIDVSRYGLIFACAQKNAGPAGVTVVIIRTDLLDRSQESLPGYLNYRNHANSDSCYNTPPTFAIYMLDLVCQWLEEEMGGLAGMARVNQEKAGMLYDLLDHSEGFYRPHARPADRSMMNVTFRLPSEQLENDFVRQAEQQGLTNLAGHRTVGGIRASIYNAVPSAGVESLRDFMKQFRDSVAEVSEHA
jgi:phosphoserine aminotransferase